MRFNGMSPAMEPVGLHIIAEVTSESNALSDADEIERIMRVALDHIRTRLIGVKTHSFGEGEGVTAIALLAESHMSVHTWPELSYAAIDVFTCGECDPVPAIRMMIDLLGGKGNVAVLSRGVRGSQALPFRWVD